MTSAQSLADRTLADIADARAWIDHRCRELAGERVATRSSDRRVLKRDCAAPVDVPAASLAACDGFAISAGASAGASAYNPLAFAPVSRGVPGMAGATAVENGAPLPDGADAVVPAEDCDVAGAFVEVTRAVAAGENVRGAGTEARAGDVIAAAGRRVRASDLALLLSAGVYAVDVVRQPSVLIACVAPAGEDHDSAMIEALVRGNGGIVGALRHADRDRGALEESLTTSEADLTIVIGGTGAGRNDFAVDALAAAGEVAMHGIALRPGETAALGLAGDRPVIVLPGIPLACMVAADFLVARAVRRLAGLRGDWAYRCRRGVLARKISSRLGRVEVARVSMNGDSVEPVAVSDEVTLATAVRADGFVVVPSSSEGFAPGTEVTVHLYS